jgi:chemotaxis methyl-accepting protein methylase
MIGNEHMKSTVRLVPGMGLVARTAVWQSYRHRVALREGPRINSNFTGFFRLPTQFEVFAGPVLRFLDAHRLGRPLRIASMGCSNGSEAYTIASLLTDRRPDLACTVHGYDLDAEIIRRARAATFEPATEVYNNRHLPEWFVDATFEPTADGFVVKEPIRRRVSFDVLNVLDTDALAAVQKMDVIFAQNFLFHLEPGEASLAFRNLIGLLNPRSAILVDGTDLGLRTRLTRECGLSPLSDGIEQIHTEARWARAIGYPHQYWGLEPLSRLRFDWKRRYATIFLRGED